MSLTIDGQANSIASSTGGVNIPATVGTLSVGPSGSYMNVTSSGTNIGPNGSYITANSSGIGIGTNNPQTALHLKTNGGAIALIESNTNYDGNIRVKNTGAYYTIGMLGGPGSTSLSFYDNNAGASRMSIDTSGRVTMPSQPAFQTTGTNYSQSGAAYSIIIPDAVPYNQGSHYNGSTGRFTAPVAGRYLFGFWGLSYPHNTEVNEIRAFLNGSGSGQLVQFGGAAHNHINHSGSILLNLSANDIFDFRYYQSSASGRAYSSQWNMWGYLIG